MRRLPPALTLWLCFIGLSFIWGSSFLFIKIGLDHGLPPLWLVTWRVWIAVAVLAIVLGVTGARLPSEPRAVAIVAVMGVINVAIPFALITWGEQFYFRLIATWGATRTALVTYVMPVVGIVLGVAVLGEQVEIREILGTILIIGGIALVNSRLGARRLAGRTAERPAA